MIVEGQVHGGVVQGIGQALWEGAVYDEEGQLVTGSLLDYAIPRADALPDIEVLSTVTPSPHHPLGVKGIGEAGTIASTSRCTTRDRCTGAVRRAEPHDAADARKSLARDAAREEAASSHVRAPRSTTTARARSPKRTSCFRAPRREAPRRRAQPDPAAQAAARGADRTHGHRTHRGSERDFVEWRLVANRIADDARRDRVVGGIEVGVPDAARRRPR